MNSLTDFPCRIERMNEFEIANAAYQLAKNIELLGKNEKKTLLVHHFFLKQFAHKYLYKDFLDEGKIASALYKRKIYKVDVIDVIEKMSCFFEENKFVNRNYHSSMFIQGTE